LVCFTDTIKVGNGKRMENQEMIMMEEEKKLLTAKFTLPSAEFKAGNN